MRASIGEIIQIGKLTYKHKVRTVVKWGEGVLGVAEFQYPHPKGWTILGASDGITIDMATVRNLTAIYRTQALKTKAPTCVSKWTERFRPNPLSSLPFGAIANVYRNAFLTPKDYHSHFKNILHRRLKVRSYAPHNGSTQCRCCGNDDESITHFPECTKLRPLYSKFIELAALAGCSINPTPELLILGVADDHTTIPRGLHVHNLLLMMYKLLIAHLTSIDTEGAKLNVAGVWTGAGHRFMTKARARSYNALLEYRAAKGARRPIPSTRSLNANLAPLAQINDWGDITWADGVVAHLTTF